MSRAPAEVRVGDVFIDLCVSHLGGVGTEVPDTVFHVGHRVWDMSPTTAGTVRNGDVTGGEPRTAGRRLTVRHIRERVEGRGLNPVTVVERYDPPLADVCRVLTSYHDHPVGVEAGERRRREGERAAGERGAPTLGELRNAE